MATKTAYGASAEEVAELFADYIEGDAARPAMALSARPLPPVAREAIEKSLAAFGYGPAACTYTTLQPGDSTVEGAEISLDPDALRLLIEGLDPVYLIAAERTAAERLAQAYRTAFDLDCAARVQGRTTAVFDDLPQLLATERGKQTAWSIFKSFR